MRHPAIYVWQVVMDSGDDLRQIRGRRRSGWLLIRVSEFARKARIKILAELGGCSELRHRFQFLERRRESVREAPHRSRPEFIVLRVEVVVMNAPGEMFRHLKLALNERLVDDHLRKDIR
jgi:hypothetical protein